MVLGKWLMSDAELLSKLPTPALVGLDDDITWHDLIVLIDHRYPDSEKLMAAQWIAHCWFKKPIAPQRWQAIGPAIRRALRKRAKANGRNPQTELKASVGHAIYLASEEAVDLTELGPRKVFRKRLNNLVAEDLLGPGWRDRPYVEIGELEEVLVAQVHFPGEVEAALELESRIAKAGLSQMEGEILKKIYQGEMPDDIAAHLGKKPGAIRTALSRARSKLRVGD